MNLLKTNLIEDFKAKASWLYGSVTLKTVLRALASDASLSIILYRLMFLCNSSFFTKPFALLITKVNAVVCGSVIGVGASFGGGFVILHSVGVVINSKVKGGSNIYIESGVVIGET